MTARNGTREPTLGVAEWFEVGERERVERVLEGLRELGIDHLRTGVSWADWFTPDGVAWFDWLLPRLAREVEILPCVAFTPPSLGEVPKPAAPPRRLRDYADFLDVLITRHGEHFEHVELWNEPNNIADWDWRLDLDWSKFAEMIGSAGNWAQSRGKKTVLGGMSPLDPNWLGLMAAKGALDCIDVVGIHGFPGTWEVDWAGWEEVVTTVRDVLDEHDLDPEIWITEAGLSTWRHDEAGQVRELVAALDASVSRVYWYCAEDLQPHRHVPSGIQTDIRHYHMGLRRRDGSAKLAARLLADGGTELVREIRQIGRRRPRRGPVSLVTGGAGFVGTNLVARLVEEGRRVRVYDSLARPGVERNLQWLADTYGDSVEVAVGDMRDRHTLSQAVNGSDAVFHFAAQVAVTTSIVDPVLDFGTNVDGTVALLEELRRLDDPPPLVFTSTNKVYGSLPRLELRRSGLRWEPVDPRTREHGISEEQALDFRTPYGCSKGAADQYVLDYAYTYGLPALVFRMSCVYGPHQHGTEDQGWVAHFLLATQANEPITIYGDGAQVRDLLHVADLVEAFLLARDNAQRLAGTPFNIGGGAANALSVLEVIELIAGIHGVEPELAFAETRVGDQRYYVSDTTRFRNETGWRPQMDAAEGIDGLYAWFERARTRTGVLPAAAR